MNDKKTILVISFTDLSRDPRVYRQLRFLADDYHVIAAGLAAPQVPGVEFIPITIEPKGRLELTSAGLQLLARQFEYYYWHEKKVVRSLEVLSGVPADLIIANDIVSLPLALRIAGGAKVIHDAHEYVSHQVADGLTLAAAIQRYKTYLARRYIPQVDGLITVSERIALGYEQETGVRAMVMTNAPDYAAIEPGFKDKDEGLIRLVHHGNADPTRKIHAMVEMMADLDERFELNLMLMPVNRRYFARLKKMAAGRRINFLEPVPMREIVPALRPFDMGVFLLPAENLSYRYALPNKFFEFIQARLAVAIGPSPEMARVVREKNLGVVADDFTPQALAASLQSLTHERLNAYKMQAHRHAHELSAESNREILLNLVRKTLTS